jgi:uncharacterized protein
MVKYPRRAMMARTGTIPRATPETGRPDCALESPMAVARPAIYHRWSEVGFVHWRFPPEAVQVVLPAGLEVDTFEGAGWVGIVPFRLDIRPAFTPELPWLSHFEEMNVRTYVRAANGATGVWFVSLDAARLPAVAIARSVLGLNYCWSKMAFARTGNVATYTAARRWPRSGAASGSLAIEIGDPLEPHRMSALDRFLTCRWAFFCKPRSAIGMGWVDHEPWPLRRGRALYVDPGLLTACGLPMPDGEPITHHSDGVRVRMSKPSALAAPTV